MAGGNDGCWATARPAAPPRPLRATLSQNPPLSRSLSPSAPPHPPAHKPSRERSHSRSRGRSSSEALYRRFSQPVLYRAMLYFGLILRHPSSCSFTLLSPGLCQSSIAFFYRILYFLCRMCSPCARFLIAYLVSRAPLTRRDTSGDFCAGDDQIEYLSG